MELLKLKMDPSAMKDVEPLRSQNPSTVCCTQWYHMAEDGKVGYIYPFLRGFLTYYIMDFVPDILNIKTINSVALEGWCGIVWEKWTESQFKLHIIWILYLQHQK